MFGKIQNKLEGILIALILVVVIIQFLAGSISYVTTSFGYLASNMTAGGVGFSGFFGSGGIVYLILGAVILLLVIGLLFTWMGGNKR